MNKSKTQRALEKLYAIASVHTEIKDLGYILDLYDTIEKSIKFADTIKRKTRFCEGGTNALVIELRNLTQKQYDLISEELL